MKVNVNQPSFIAFLESISNNILSSIKIDDYFELPPDKKLVISFTVLNLIRNSAKVKADLSDSELKSFIIVLWRKNEELENYEFAAILDNVIKNFDSINNTAAPKKSTRTKKINQEPKQ